MASTAVATRTSSPAFTRIKEELEKAKANASALRKRATESRVPTALMGSGAGIAAAAATGALKGAYGDDEFMGIPIDAGAGIALVVAGVALDNEWLIYAGGGPLAAYANRFAEDAVSDWMSPDAQNQKGG